MLAPIATDWATISSLATGAGTLVLAVATFAAVRSSNRSARVAEQALREQRRPIFAQSRLDDPPQKIMFVEGHWVRARGGHGVAEHDGSIYLAMSMRNVGTGIGVCQGWHVTRGQQSVETARDHAPEDEFRLQTRDLYIPAGDIGMWQGALRDRNDPLYKEIAGAIDEPDIITIELLYTDQVGDQRTISRFGLIPYEREDEHGHTGVEWFASINRHWYLDGIGPRSDDEVAAAAAVVRRDREAGEELARAEAEATARSAAESADGANGAPDQPAGTETAASRDADETDGGEPDATPDREPVGVIPRPNCE
jgi:hypothetical protein